MRVSSGLNAADMTKPVWPCSNTRLRPDAASHTLAVLSSER